MIQVNVKYQNNALYEVLIHGHAGYDDYGRDIVCAAVSTLATTTINHILILEPEGIIYDTSDGNLKITIQNGNVIATKLMQNMLNMMQELMQTYPKNIKIGGLK